MERKGAIILGASSGIGRALAHTLDARGYSLGLAARRTAALHALQGELKNPGAVEALDIRETADVPRVLEALIEALGDVELIVVSSGVGLLNPELDWEREAQTLATNVTGFAAAAHAAMHYFERRGGGHLVGLSSVAALRGGYGAPAYNASKAFVSNYLEGLRVRAQRQALPITVSDIKPGFVHTPMTEGVPLFWAAPVEKAAAQIDAAIRKKKHHAYITRRWRLVAWLLKILPDGLYRRL